MGTRGKKISNNLDNISNILTTKLPSYIIDVKVDEKSKINCIIPNANKGEADDRDNRFKGTKRDREGTSRLREDMDSSLEKRDRTSMQRLNDENSESTDGYQRVPFKVSEDPHRDRKLSSRRRSFRELRKDILSDRRESQRVELVLDRLSEKTGIPREEVRRYYDRYIVTIFPKSEISDILYHGTNRES